MSVKGITDDSLTLSIYTGEGEPKQIFVVNVIFLLLLIIGLGVIGYWFFGRKKG